MSEVLSVSKHLVVPPAAGQPQLKPPTPQLAEELQAAFHFFNHEFRLMDCGRFDRHHLKLIPSTARTVSD